jgi:hypothetical protein
VKGRTVGVPNKFSSERAAAVEREGKRLPPANLLIIAENCLAMAARYAPMWTNADTKQPEANPKHNEERYGYWLAQERDALKAAAPYYAPRLSAIALQPLQLEKDKELRADPRVALLEMILQMRDRDEVELKALPVPNGNGQIIDAVVEQVLEEDDSADGEAA